MKNEMRLQGIGMVEGTEAGKIQVGDILRWNHGGLSKVVSFELSKTGKTINCKVEVINSRTGEKEIYERSMRVTRLVNIVASANTNNDFNLQFDPIEEAPEAEEVAEESVAMLQLKKRVEARKAEKAPEFKEVVAEEKIKVTWFDYSKDEAFTEEVTQNKLAFLEMVSHIDVDKVEKVAEEVTEAPESELIEMLEGMVAKKELDRKKIEMEYTLKQIEEANEEDLKKSVHEVTYRVTNHGSYVEVMLFVTDVANDVTLVAQQEGEFDSMEEAETLISYLKKTGNKIEFVETIAYTG